MSAIFISYRRDDSSGYAGRLFDRLVQRFGRERLFMDIENLEPGMDFVAAIDRAIASCGAVIALIGPDWLRARDAQGRARLDDPHDFIRLEIAAALKRDIRVIPVLVHGAEMPQEQDLPEPLRPLARLQATELSDNRWEFDVGRLADVLESLLGRRRKAGDEAARPAGRGRLWAGLAAGLAAVVGVGWWALQPAPSTGDGEKADGGDLRVEQRGIKGPRVIMAEAGKGGQPPAAVEPQAEAETIGAMVAAPGQVAALGSVTGKGSSALASAERTPAVTRPARPEVSRDEPLAPPPPRELTRPTVEAAVTASVSGSQAGGERRIARLLAQADEDLRSNRLTRPPKGNALARYRQVLALNPGNAQAQEGIRRIGVRYRRLAEQALTDGRIAAARRHLAAAASVDPKLPWLASMRRRIADANAAAIEPARSVPAAPQTGANDCRQGCREAQSACRESARGRGDGCLAGVKAQCEEEYKACMNDSNLAMIWGSLAHQSECRQAQALCERKGRERCDAAPDEALARCDTQAERCLAECR